MSASGHLMRNGRHLTLAASASIARSRDAFSTRARSLQTLVQKIGALPANALQSLDQLTNWTVQYLGLAIIGPMARNRDWATDLEAISLLESQGLIRCESCTWEGSSLLKNRLVGEAVGEYFWNASENPFRGNEILEPQ
jgi:hypothetical protein